MKTLAPTGPTLIALAGCCRCAFSAELPLAMKNFGLDYDNEVPLKLQEIEFRRRLRYTLYRVAICRLLVRW